MIEIECDNCEKLFSVDDAEAGGKVPCPSCGDVNRVPGARPSPASEPAPSPAAAAAGAPAAEPSAESGERELAVVRPAMFRAHPFRYCLVVLSFVVSLGVAVASQVSDRVWDWVLWPGVIATLVSLGWFAHWWISTHWWMKLIISNKRTVRHEGIIRRHTTEVLHDHVRSVDIEQNFIQRIMGVGAMGIDSAGQEDIEIQVRDIPRPYEVKQMIDKYRKM